MYTSDRVVNRKAKLLVPAVAKKFPGSSQSEYPGGVYISEQYIVSLSRAPVIVGDEVMGELVGDAVGDVVGEVVGESVGDVDGDVVGEAVGESVGDVDGDRVGLVVGDAVGDRVGAAVGPVVHVLHRAGHACLKLANEHMVGD